MIAVALLVLAIASIVLYPRAKGSARMFLFLVMLASISVFLYTIVHLAHPGL